VLLPIANDLIALRRLCASIRNSVSRNHQLFLPSRPDDVESSDYVSMIDGRTDGRTDAWQRGADMRLFSFVDPTRGGVDGAAAASLHASRRFGARCPAIRISLRLCPSSIIPRPCKYSLRVLRACDAYNRPSGVQLFLDVSVVIFRQKSALTIL